MQLLLHAKTNPAALWVVSNGEVTIGPVRTELLLRGIRHGESPARLSGCAPPGRTRMAAARGPCAR